MKIGVIGAGISGLTFAAAMNFVFCDQRGRVLLELSATGNETRLTQRVKRSTLKTILLEAIGETPIHSGMPAKGHRQDDWGVEVHFENGQTAPADYLVACDGVASAIRQQMIGDQKRYLGLTTILVDSPHLLEHPLLEGGYFLMLEDNGTSTFCYRQPDGVHLSYTVRADAEAEIKAQAPASLLGRIQQETRSWHQPVPEVAVQAELASVVVRGYYDKEPLHQVRQGRVWLIGDTAHPMSPFQGQGANMAMVDALKLAQLFGETAADPGGAETKAQALEKDIVTRGRKAVLESRNAARQFHRERRSKQMFRNFGFRMGNVFIRLAAKK